MGKKLEPGWLSEVEYVKTVDGDTITFSITRIFNIRLRGIDVEELNTEKGENAKNFVDNLMQKANNIKAFVPSNNPQKLMDFNSFERIVGDVYINDQNLSTILRRKGYEK